MDKKGIQEIKKCFKKEDCRIDRIRSCFVSEEGEVLSQFSDSFFSLEDEEMHKYCALFKQSLSGKFGRELYTLEFPLSEEETGGKQDSLYRLNESELKEAGLCENFFQKIRESYPVPGKKLLILAHGVYDVPQKGKDGITMEDASDTVYSFTLFLLCPVSLLKEGLCFDKETDSFIARSEDFVVQKPEISFLYPAFHERSSDIHALLYRAKKREEGLDTLTEELFGIPLPYGEKEQKGQFSALVQEVLKENCNFENVRSLQEELQELKEQGKEEEKEQTLSKSQLKQLLENAGATEEGLANFSALYDESLGEHNSSFYTENLVNSSLHLKSENLQLKIKNEVSTILESKIIDGKEYLLLPVSDNLEVNGIPIRRRLELE
jgi:hypothetical protein